MGPQNLYNVTITFTPAGPGALPVATTRRVGFRFAALVTVNDTDPAVVAASANAEGTGNFTMMYVFIVLGLDIIRDFGATSLGLRPPSLVLLAPRCANVG